MRNFVLGVMGMTLLVFLWLLVIALLLSRSAHSHAIACLPFETLDETLRQGSGETPRWHGLDSEGARTVLYESSTGTWTLMAVTPRGLACISSVGEGSDMLPVTAPAEDA